MLDVLERETGWRYEVAISGGELEPFDEGLLARMRAVPPRWRKEFGTVFVRRLNSSVPRPQSKCHAEERSISAQAPRTFAERTRFFACGLRMTRGRVERKISAILEGDMHRGPG